jgi:hypothetical protein
VSFPGPARPLGVTPENTIPLTGASCHPIRAPHGLDRVRTNRFRLAAPTASTPGSSAKSTASVRYMATITAVHGSQGRRNGPATINR